MEAVTRRRLVPFPSALLRVLFCFISVSDWWGAPFQCVAFVPIHLWLVKGSTYFLGIKRAFALHIQKYMNISCVRAGDVAEGTC